jgi:large subunit ribosomal protein L35
MQKTKKAIAKRFKVTGTGKIVRYGKPGHRHCLSAKSSKRKRSACQHQVVPKGMAAKFKKALPFA